MRFQSGWDLEKSKKRLEACLHQQVVDRCCIAAMAKIDPSKPWDKNGTARMPCEFIIEDLDLDQIKTRAAAHFDNTYFAGDALPILWPNFGVAGHAKYFKNVKYSWHSGSLWYEHLLTGEYPDSSLLEFDPNGRLQEELEVLRFLCKEANGNYFVSAPDHAGGVDVLSVLRGNAELMCDMLEYPQEVKACNHQILEALERSYDQIFQVVRENNQGGTIQGWMNSYSSGRHHHLQCDFSVMISPELYREFVLPELLESTEKLDDAIYHFDGQEQRRHLDMILSVPKIRQIQWTHVAGQPNVSEFIDTLKEIQQAGKGLLLAPEPEEVEFLLKNLSSKGLKIVLRYLNSPEEADYFVKLAERLTHE